MISQLYFGLEQIKPGGLPQTDASSGEIKIILQIVFGIIGGLALLFITLSGLRYITAAGDPQRMQQAKEGIIYALVGIAIAVTAEALVAFVLRGLQ